jgi:RHS repeat-associated protein
MQVTQLGLGASATDTGIWKVNYEYGELMFDGTTVDTSKNTGNIAKQTLTLPGTSFVQSYRYDSLYRLTEAKERTGASQTNNWIQNWTYDRYGNRQAFTQNIGGSTTVTNPSVNQNTNRFTSSDFIYDKNGNVTRDRDGVTNQLRTFVFNGENKQIEVRDGNNAPIGQYFYDGEGKRVKKFITATGETTIFVYSNGKLVAEYSNNIAGPSEAKIAYTTTDHLGSPRVITDDIGQVRSRRDFLPFGEEINVGIGGRTGESGQGYSVPTDGVRQKFTGYQKDTETSLDFAEARMYENRFGRFTAVDPLLASGKSANPQTFNRYGYVLNNPLVMIDPDGEKPVYLVKHGKPGYASWYWVESTSKSYDALKRKGYEDYQGPMGQIIHSHGKYFQLTGSGFQLAKPPTNSGEKSFDSGNNPFVGMNIFGSAFDNVVPFGQQLRHKLGFNIVDENSKEYNNFGTAATIVQLPFLIKSLPSLGSKVLGKADDGVELGSAMFRTADNTAEKGSYVIYQGFDSQGIVRYVGMTRRDPGIRFTEHANSKTARSLLDYRLVDGSTGLTKIQARTWEQGLINRYGLGRNGGSLFNKINSVAPKYWQPLGIQ